MSQSSDARDPQLFTKIELNPRWKECVLKGFSPLEKRNIGKCLSLLRATVSAMWNSDTVLNCKGDGRSTSSIIQGWFCIISAPLNRYDTRRLPEREDGKKPMLSYLSDAVDCLGNLSDEEKSALKLSIIGHMILLNNALLSLKVNHHVNVWAEDGDPVVDKARNEFQIWVGSIKTHLANLDRDMQTAWGTEEMDFSLWLQGQINKCEGLYTTIQPPWHWSHRD